MRGFLRLVLVVQRLDCLDGLLGDVLRELRGRGRPGAQLLDDLGVEGVDGGVDAGDERAAEPAFSLGDLEVALDLVDAQAVRARLRFQQGGPDAAGPGDPDDTVGVDRAFTDGRSDGGS